MDKTQGVGRPGVTACVPTYCSADFIKRTLDSLATQTYAPLDVLISDDGSRDDTVALCEAAAAGDPRFRIVRQTRRLGWTGNVNYLLGEADTSFVFLMPHDDWLDPTYVEKLVGRLEAEPNAVLAYADSEEWRIGKGKSSTVFAEGIRGAGPRARGARFIRFEYGCWLPYRGLIRRQALERVGGLRRNRRGEVYADIDWLLALSLEGAFVRVPEALYYKEYQKTSLTYQWALDHRDMLAALWACAARVAESRVGPWGKAVLWSIIGRRLARKGVRLLLEQARLMQPPPDWRE